MTVAECIEYVEEHMEIRFATKNKSYKSGRTIHPIGCVNHSIGCAQPSVETIYSLMNRETTGWGVNALLGDFHKGEGKIIVALRFDPDNQLCSRPAGCGGGVNGSWNNTHIQWEICEPAGHTYAGGTMLNYDVARNAGYFARMWKLLVAWNVYCAVKFGYPVSAIHDHAESHQAGMGTNHSDVGHWFPKHGKSMQALRDEVQGILDAEEDSTMDVGRFKELWLEMRKELQDNDSSAYSDEAKVWAVNSGLVTGGQNAGQEFNGMWEDVLTKEQMVTILYRFAKLLGKTN